jgi:hypothetical protein
LTQQPSEIPYYFEKLLMGSLISAAMSSIIFLFFMSFRTYVSDPSTLVSYVLLFAGIFFAGFFSGMFILEVPRIVPFHGGLTTGIILGIICLGINLNVVIVNETVDLLATALIFIAAIVSAVIGAYIHSNYLAKNQ